MTDNEIIEEIEEAEGSDENTESNDERSEFEDVLLRIQKSNAEVAHYDFEWDAPDLLNYANDESLEVALTILEKGKFSLTTKDNKLLIRSRIQGLCDKNITTAEFLENNKKDPNYAVREDFNNLTQSLDGRLMNSYACDSTCKFSTCPKLLAGYLLYLYNNKKLIGQLEQRKVFRAANQLHNGFFLFVWKNEFGLKTISDEVFEYAQELIKQDLIRVERTLFKGNMRITNRSSCRKLQMDGLDTQKISADYTWEQDFHLTRSTISEPHSFCNVYSCHLPACLLEIAGYIYYLQKSGQEDVITQDREYYHQHKEEMDQKAQEIIDAAIEKANKRKEETLKDLKESYEGKIENLQLTINSAVESDKTNFHCLVVGDEKEEQQKFVNKIIDVLKANNDSTLTVKTMPATHFARLFYHYSDMCIAEKNSELQYGDTTKFGTAKKDEHGIPYVSEWQAHRKNTLENNVIYVLEDLQTFINDYRQFATTNDYNISKMMNNALDVLTDMSQDKFVIIKATKDEVEPFVALDARLKFVYQSNIIVLPNYSIEDMYNEFINLLSSDILDKWRKNEEENKKIFTEYVTLNQRFLPFDKKATVNYLATYINTRNDITMPPNIYKKETFDNLIGLETVKQKVRDFEDFMLFQIQAKANGMSLAAPNMHMLFTGNAGTGKTTVARKMAKMLFDLGVVKENKLIEVERKDLVAEYIGQTAPKTAEVIDKALNGVLFIDEAYTLAPSKDNDRDFGREAIATLIKAMEDHKDKLVVIFAGYKDEMRKFVDSNPGIASRIGYKFDFPDYSPDELMQIFQLKLRKAGFKCEEQANTQLKRVCNYFSKKKNFGNGRFVDKVTQETLIKHALRKPDPLDVVTEEDIPSIEELNEQLNNKRNKSAEEMLNSLVGMDEIKQELITFTNYVSFVKKAEEKDMNLPAASMHMIFTGNAGTGKTTVARIIAKMLFEIGVLYEDKLIEVERKDLIGEYIGQTAPKTADVIDKALGGVLFIDEAYSLTQNHSGNDYGAEAVATLIKAMEDHKGEFVVILAGYKNEMRTFVNSNPGIASRIGYIFNFNDYDDVELTEIFKRKINGAGLEIQDDVLKEVKAIMKYFYKVENFGNGRFVDKVISKTLLKHASNIQTLEDDSSFKMIGVNDIPSIEEMTRILLDGSDMINPEKIKPEDLKKTAVHEVGHATVGHLLMHTGFKKITCTAEGIGSLGYVEMDDQQDSYTHSKEQLMNRIKMLLAGIASEEIFLGVYQSGGVSDLEKATGIAQRIITEFGMSDLGLVHIDAKNQALGMLIYQEENKILNTCFEEVKELIKENKERMSKVVDYLLERGEITEEEFIKVFGGKE